MSPSSTRSAKATAFSTFAARTWARNRPKHTANGWLVRFVQDGLAELDGPRRLDLQHHVEELAGGEPPYQPPESPAPAESGPRCTLRYPGVAANTQGERAAAFDLCLWFRINASPVTSSSSGRSCVPVSLHQ